MKILMTNWSLSWLGGTQTWVKTMAQELKNLGHEVHLFAGDGKYGLMPEWPKFDPSAHYDLALVNHNVCLDAIEGVDIDLKVFTSHGIIPHLEQPVKGADLYVSVSEEVQANLESKGFASTILRNPIDLGEFNNTKFISTNLQNVLFMSNYQGDARTVVELACKSAGLNLRVFGKEGSQTNDVKKEMNWADLVIGLGRTAYEAMACMRNVIIYDYNGADGVATPESLLEFRKNNCSGRRFAIKPTHLMLKDWFEKYDAKLGPELRQYIVDNNNVKRIAQQYVDLRNHKG